MMMLTHAAVSGGLGELVVNPYIAFPLGIATHLMLDKVPHTYVAEIMKNGILKYLDTFSTLLFMILLFLVPTAHQAGLIWGAFGGIIVDVYLLGVIKNKGKVADWHSKRQPHKENSAFVLTDVAIFFVGLILIWLFK